MYSLVSTQVQCNFEYAVGWDEFKKKYSVEQYPAVFPVKVMTHKLLWNVWSSVGRPVICGVDYYNISLFRNRIGYVPMFHIHKEYNMYSLYYMQFVREKMITAQRMLVLTTSKIKSASWNSCWNFCIDYKENCPSSDLLNSHKFTCLSINVPSRPLCSVMHWWFALGSNNKSVQYFRRCPQWRQPALTWPEVAPVDEDIR